MNAFTPHIAVANNLLKERGYKSIAGSTAAEIAELEQQIKSSLPSEVVEWLTLCRGVSFSGEAFIGVEHRHGALSINMKMTRSELWNQQWIPVASDAFGNYFVLMREIGIDGEHPVGFVEGTSFNEMVGLAASSLYHFVPGFIEMARHEDEGWFFEKKNILRSDPHIKKIKQYPRLWELD